MNKIYFITFINHWFYRKHLHRLKNITQNMSCLQLQKTFNKIHSFHVIYASFPSLLKSYLRDHIHTLSYGLGRLALRRTYFGDLRYSSSPEDALVRRVHGTAGRALPRVRELLWVREGADHPESVRAVHPVHHRWLQGTHGRSATPHLQSKIG